MTPFVRKQYSEIKTTADRLGFSCELHHARHPYALIEGRKFSFASTPTNHDQALDNNRKRLRRFIQEIQHARRA